jgi:hypothetical protein
VALWRRGGQHKGVAPARSELVRGSREPKSIQYQPKYFPLLQVILDMDSLNSLLIHFCAGFDFQYMFGKVYELVVEFKS